MKWFFNLFSGHSYTETNNILTSDEGKVFTKVGNDWLSQDGDYIRRDNSGYMNTQTGVSSTWGDPFED